MEKKKFADPLLFSKTAPLPLSSTAAVGTTTVGSPTKSKGGNGKDKINVLDLPIDHNNMLNSVKHKEAVTIKRV